MEGGEDLKNLLNSGKKRGCWPPSQRRTVFGKKAPLTGLYVWGKL